ncbi:hypothetical protein [uncultured Tenacibaculum sp.]|uniref:hypothetical protein n=1 Tax=uncultured Tenacibaculum sp. TaxID=174713 RepID=UPI002623408B|nr:hypothetical protein [uncultured Tenacibaculum sp.]
MFQISSMVPRLEKSFHSNNQMHQTKARLSLSYCCRLFEINRQAIYQSERRFLFREQELIIVKKLVKEIRVIMSRIGTKKL